MSDVVTVPVFDESENKIHFCRVQDVEPILENNQRLRSESQKSETWRHVGSIPNVVIEGWLADEWRRGNIGLKWSDEEFAQLIARKLRDIDWQKLRTDK